MDKQKEQKKHKEEKTVEMMQDKLDEMENNWKRALADYKNLQKRVEEEKSEMILLSNISLVSRLIPVLDNLELMEKHLKDEGIKLIAKEFKQVLKDVGVEELDVESKDFDPAVMEAVEVVEGKEGKVLEVTQKGYKIFDKLLRPARVKVGKSNESM